MANYVELKNLVDLTLLTTFKTQMDTKFQAKLDEKEAVGVAATLVGNEKTRAEAAEKANADAIADIVKDYLKAADKTELQGQITTNKNDIATLNGTGEGSVKKAIDDAFNDFATKVSDDGVVNTYKELIDYAASHGAEFTELVGKVSTIETNLGNLTTLVGTIPEGSTATTVTGYAKEIVDAEATRAKAAEEANKTAIDALKEQVGEGGTVDNKIATAKSEAIAAAKEYTDGKDTAMDTRVAALETWAGKASLATEADILAMFN